MLLFFHHIYTFYLHKLLQNDYEADLKNLIVFNYKKPGEVPRTSIISQL